MTKAGKSVNLLDTTEDIEWRKQLTNTAFSKLNLIFTNTYVGIET